MATSFKTPGVYVVEKSIFPPSVAEVETAIPGFIGYTEKATEYKSGDLQFVCKKDHLTQRVRKILWLRTTHISEFSNT